MGALGYFLVAHRVSNYVVLYLAALLAGAAGMLL
jgi:hypothetical protein